MKILSRVFLDLLAILGAFVGIVSMIPDAETVDVTFTYQGATEREGGTPLSLEEIKHTRLFCVFRMTGSDESGQSK